MTVNLPARRLLIIFNPAAGGRRRRRLQAVLERLEAAGCGVTGRETSGPGNAERFAAEADARQCDRLVVAGGDGTVNEAVNGLAGSVIVANGRYYAGRYLCARDGSLEQPELAVCLFERSSRWSVAVYAAALLTGRLPDLASYRVVAARHVVIAGQPVEPLQGDGDIIGRLDAEIRMLPEALNLVFPPARGGG